MEVLSIVPLEDLSRAMEVCSRIFSLEDWLAHSQKLAEQLHEFLSKSSPVTVGE